jgi:hypothetical protein
MISEYKVTIRPLFVISIAVINPIIPAPITAHVGFFVGSTNTLKDFTERKAAPGAKLTAADPNP